MAKEADYLSIPNAKKLLDESYQNTLDVFPRTTLAAYYYVLGMLALHQPNRAAGFRGECAITMSELSDLVFVHSTMAGILENELEGNPNVNPFSKEAMCRHCLGLPPLGAGGRAIDDYMIFSSTSIEAT